MEMTLALVGMFLLIALGVPIAFALAIVGLIGMILMVGVHPAIAQLMIVAWEYSTGFTIIAIPLFVLMGELLFYSGLATEIYSSTRKLFGHLSGGLAIATVVASALFAACTGSSVAACATIGSIAYPEMKRYNYDAKLATGCIACAGTLGIMIPPSNIFIFYGIFTETSIGKLFMAGVLPGILTAFLWISMVWLMCKRNPLLGPSTPKLPWKERILGMKQIWPVPIIFLVILGGIYGGIFTATEAASIGVGLVLLMLLFARRLSSRVILDSVRGTTRIAVMVIFIIIGGVYFSHFLVLTGTIATIVNAITGLPVNPIVIIIALMPLYLFLGCVLDVLGMIVLTLPFVFPVIIELGFSPVWFGVVICVLSEVALVTPPIGVNVFTMHGVAPEVPLPTIFRGVVPFFLRDLMILALIIAFPQICLWLPGTMR
ncbi:TRAP transporter large permease [Chloroflexota bacterium]